MPLPPTSQSPPFRITRLSHVVLNVSDLNASRRFYEQLIGLIVTRADHEAVYLRGVEEVCHHSLVLQRSRDEPTADRIGFRVLTGDDLDAAARFFAEQGRAADWAEVPHQGRTLSVSDAALTPLELCAHMPT